MPDSSIPSASFPGAIHAQRGNCRSLSVCAGFDADDADGAGEWHKVLSLYLGHVRILRKEAALPTFPSPTACRMANNSVLN